ncbi:MAG: hypothetical protein N3A69_15410, partial [Leptospiraceae bacterium]|nr:hypothetical protein [Leptospiraceae bacterium]
ATTFKTTTGIEITLPSAKSVETIKSSTLRITIKDEENIFIENYKTTIKIQVEILFELVPHK